MQLAREELEQAYRQMKTIREFEDHLHREIAKGTIVALLICMVVKKLLR